jgi:DNA-binding NtrC family response regulator
MNRFSYGIYRLLLIDDDEDDNFLFEKALKQVDPSIHLKIVKQVDLMASGIIEYAPDLIFLDINFPLIDGITCLKVIQSVPIGSMATIIMYSSSGSPQEIQEAYVNGASLYLQKPPAYEVLVQSLQQILKMDWSQPESIKSNQQKGNRFVPFTLT